MARAFCRAVQQNHASQPKQPLLNEDFRSYNYDVIDGVTYEIDVSQPSKYDADGNVADENARRIVNLQYDGEPVTDEQAFLVATNNYRALGGGAFPGLDGSREPRAGGESGRSTSRWCYRNFAFFSF